VFFQKGRNGKILLGKEENSSTKKKDRGPGMPGWGAWRGLLGKKNGTPKGQGQDSKKSFVMRDTGDPIRETTGEGKALIGRGDRGTTERKKGNILSPCRGGKADSRSSKRPEVTRRKGAGKKKSKESNTRAFRGAKSLGRVIRRPS